MISCIEVQNVRPAPEFRVLVPGNLGFLHQFSLEKGTPQFCLASDLEARPAAADTAGAAAAAAVAGTGGDAAHGESGARGGGGGAGGRRMTSPHGTAVVAGPTAAGETASSGGGGGIASRGKSDGCDGALPKDRLNFVERQQGSLAPLVQCRRKPSEKQINQQVYCNKEYYGRLNGSVIVYLGEKEASFELNLQLHMVSADGSCALYCLLQAVRDAKASTTFWNRLLGLRTDRPRLVEGMETLAQIADADTVGCPRLRKTLCVYMLSRAALPGLWKDPPEPENSCFSQRSVRSVWARLFSLSKPGGGGNLESSDTLAHVS